jgi:hypothetical protein
MTRNHGTVVDGFGFDTFAAPGDRYLRGEARATHGGDETIDALWVTLGAKAARPGTTGLDRQLGRALWASAERQLRASSKRFEGHHARALLTFYLARQVRGVALAAMNVLGSAAPTAMPLIDDGAVRAALAISMKSKEGGRLYDAVFAALDPALSGVPTTRREDIRDADQVPRRSQSPEAADAIAACLRDGPLAPHVLPGRMNTLSRHERGEPPRVPHPMLGPAHFHLWHERYCERLADVDVGELIA